ncbi:hypothetical protein JR316_0006248 [Psilocybe cubensis]|uniref:Uncharacterized protein n=1 Tax=Psilocybe cubensis TaxID=181762 RepID=A0ACB8H2L2_PSICU|nr:hypothetical protein JR316_0006248 [Psilocybe cubensis]KAH9481721.1 hypothetical protein JR316_0006248 [Psilocybe cubensis]
MTLYFMYSLKLHQFIPAITTWPSQRHIVVELTTFARHKLIPWTFKSDEPQEVVVYSSNRKKGKSRGRGSNRGKRTPFTRHIVAVGDLHGDIANARRVLRFADVIDEHNNWSGNVDFFVQTGDIIDRGDDTIVLFLWMERLRAQAAEVGGTVLSHLGNHEWMNAIGDWRYVYPSELKTFGSIAARQRMLTSGRIGRAWATNYTTASRLPLHPFIGPPNTPYPPPHSFALHMQQDDDDLHWRDGQESESEQSEEEIMSHAALSFVHGGLSPSYPELTPFPTRINELSDTLLARLQNRKQPPPHPPHPYPGFPPETSPEEIRMYSANGPLWYRGWAMQPEEVVCAQVDDVLQKTGTRRMIMGHTPDFKNIKSRCNGKIIIIDTGISHAYGGVLSALSVHYTLTPIPNSPNTKQKQNQDNEDDHSHRWMEREVISALYADRQEIIVTDEREVVGTFRHHEFHDGDWEDEDGEMEERKGSGEVQ